MQKVGVGGERKGKLFYQNIAKRPGAWSGRVVKGNYFSWGGGGDYGGHSRGKCDAPTVQTDGGERVGQSRRKHPNSETK